MRHSVIMRNRRASATVGAAVAVLAIGWLNGGCEASDSGKGQSTASGEGDFGDDAFSPTGSGDGTGDYSVVGTGGAGGSVAPPEVEGDLEFELPHAGQRYVYAVNPESDTVAVIDATTLAIHTVPTGERPRYLQTLAGTDSAIVLNVDSEDATVIRTEDGESEYDNLPVRSGANAIAVAPDGQHAVVYYDSGHSGEAMSAGNFQDVTVLTLREGDTRATDMTVGYRPSSVHFDADSEHAYVVTENGVSVLDLAAVDEQGSGQASTVPLGDGVDDPGSDVSVTLDGRYAMAQQSGNRVLRLVDLEDRTSQLLDVVALVEAELGGDADGAAGAGGTGAVPTVAPGDLLSDVDLSPDSQYVIAVVRYAGAVVRIPLPEGFADPSLAEITRITEGRIGQVSLAGDGARAVLFTTADPTDERLTIIDLDGEVAPTAVDLHKAVAQVAITPDGKTAFVVHQVTAGNPSDTPQEQQVDRSEGYSLVNLDTAFSKLEVTPTTMGSFTLVPEADGVFISYASPPSVHRVTLSNFVQTTIELASSPLALGSVPLSRQVFVSQEHPDGRITFIDWDTSDISTVTGFELNSSIVEAR